MSATARTHRVEPSCLFPDETEIARLVLQHLGQTKAWLGLAEMLERQGLPRRDPLFGNRRYLPAVLAYLQRRHSLSEAAQGLAPDGAEDWT